MSGITVVVLVPRSRLRYLLARPLFRIGLVRLAWWVGGCRALRFHKEDE